MTTDPYWQYNCGAYSAAMLIVDTTTGGLRLTGRQVRALSSEPVPDPASPGLNIPQVLNVMRKLHLEAIDMQGQSWATVIDALADGRRVTLSVDYESLGAYRCQANGDFGHQLVLIKISTDRDTIAVSDPLCKAPKNVPADTLLRAARRFASDTGLASGVRYGMTRVIPRVEG